MKLTGFLFVIVCLVFSVLALADAPKAYSFVSYNDALKIAKQKNKKIFLYFGRYGCGYCEKTNKETFSNKALRVRYHKNYVLVYIDAESGDRLTLPSGETITQAELGVRLKVYATPVFIYLDATGKIIFKAPGFKTVQDFVFFDQYIQGGHYQSMSINQFIAKQKKK